MHVDGNFRAWRLERVTILLLGYVDVPATFLPSGLRHRPVLLLEVKKLTTNTGLRLFVPHGIKGDLIKAHICVCRLMI